MTSSAEETLVDLAPLLGDQPSENDYLEFEGYVETLYRSIVFKETKTPLTMGIFGRWGTGKTTLMNMLAKKLNKWGAIIIWFNAWQYAKEDELWAAFLQSLINKLQGQLNFWQRPIFSVKLLVRRIKWRSVPWFIFRILWLSLIAIIPLLLTEPIPDSTPNAGEMIVRYGGVIAATGLATWLVIKPLIEAIQENLTIDFSTLKQESDFEKHVAFLDKFREHFSDIVACLPKTNEKRLVIFIDDLDRCSPDRILQVLDAVKMFVDISGCVFVLGVDAVVVQNSLKYKYKEDSLAQKEYLDKIIQVSFYLPPLRRKHMESLLSGLQVNFPDKRCEKVFTEGMPFNPRKFKRAINVFSLLWNQGKINTLFYVDSESERLTKNLKPVRLAKVIVIQNAYPDLHEILHNSPNLLKELEIYFRLQQQPNFRSLFQLQSSQTPRHFTRRKLLEAITNYFNLEELRELCFSLNVDYENLPGEGKADKARELIIYFERRDRTDQLIRYIQKERPLISSLEDSSPDTIEPELLAENINDSLKPFLNVPQLGRMLALHQEPEDESECNFSQMELVPIERYFTLTSRSGISIIESTIPN